MATNFVLNKSAGSVGSSPTILSAVENGAIVIPGENALLKSDFSRSGSDLVITTPDGTQFFVPDYFSLTSAPALRNEGGAEIPADLVMALAGPLTPGQHADLDVSSPQQPIGQVDNALGEVIATRVDGTTVTLSNGSAIYQGDILETGKEGAVSIVFVDETEFSLGTDARMVLDELIFDPTSLEGTSTFSVVQGVFVFVSGEIAANNAEAMIVRTPVATLGIRGTKVAGRAAAEGNLNSVTLMPDENDVIGSILVSNASGTVALSTAFQTATISSVFDKPVHSITLNAAQADSLFGGVDRLLATNNVERATPEQRNEAEAREQSANPENTQAVSSDQESIPEGESTDDIIIPEDQDALVGSEESLDGIDDESLEQQEALTEQGPDGEFGPGPDGEFGPGPDGEFGPGPGGEFGPGPDGEFGPGPDGEFGPGPDGEFGPGPDGEFGPGPDGDFGPGLDVLIQQSIAIEASLVSENAAFSQFEAALEGGADFGTAIEQALVAQEVLFNSIIEDGADAYFQSIEAPKVDFEVKIQYPDQQDQDFNLRDIDAFRDQETLAEFAGALGQLGLLENPNFNPEQGPDGEFGPGPDGEFGPGPDGEFGPGPDGEFGPGPDGEFGPGPDGEFGPGPDGEFGPGPDGEFGPGPDGDFGPGPDGDFGPGPDGDIGPGPDGDFGPGPGGDFGLSKPSFIGGNPFLSAFISDPTGFNPLEVLNIGGNQFFDPLFDPLAAIQDLLDNALGIIKEPPPENFEDEQGSVLDVLSINEIKNASTIFGTAGNDTLQGGSGVDIISGNEGDDTLLGLAGNDAMLGGPGSDVIEGGTGNDAIAGDGVASSPSISAILNLTENPSLDGNDTISGGSGSDDIIGLGGDDVITGGSGADFVNGGSGDDQIDGGEGNDDLEGGSGDDSIDGGEGDDFLTGGDGNDTLLGGIGFDDIIGNGGDDLITGGSGNDTISGVGGNDSISGGDGVDRISGNAGNDTLLGGAGDDIIAGDEGADTITGGEGSDVIAGGDGADIFAYVSESDGGSVSSNVTKGNVAGDTVGDFDPGVDKFDISSSGFKILSSGTLSSGSFTDLKSSSEAYDGTNSGKSGAVFIYDNTNTLYFDADTSAAGYTVIAETQSGISVSNTDIVIS